VNLRGEFNIENVVKYDSEEDLKNDTRLTGSLTNHVTKCFAMHMTNSDFINRGAKSLLYTILVNTKLFDQSTIHFWRWQL
jgi:hypothetical protein